MHALGDRIGLEHELGAGLGREQRAVVLEPEGARRSPRASGARKPWMMASSPASCSRCPALVSPLHLEPLRRASGKAGEGSLPARSGSSPGAQLAGELSSTPLTTFGSSPSKKACATSTYSLMTTRAGTSVRSISSKAPARRMARRIEVDAHQPPARGELLVDQRIDLALARARRPSARAAKCSGSASAPVPSASALARPADAP